MGGGFEGDPNYLFTFILIGLKFQLPRLPGSRTSSFRLNPIGGEGMVVSGDNFSLSHISSSWVEISLHTEFQLPRSSGSRTAIFRPNPFIYIYLLHIIYILYISSRWVERSLHAKFKLPRLPGSGSSMVGDKTTTMTKQLGRIRGFLSPS